MFLGGIIFLFQETDVFQGIALQFFFFLQPVCSSANQTSFTQVLTLALFSLLWLPTQQLRRDARTWKEGFSVVAPLSLIIPHST